MKDLLNKINYSLYECAIPKYLELVRLSGKPSTLNVIPFWFLHNWLEKPRLEMSVRRLCFDLENENINPNFIHDIRVYPQGFLTIPLKKPLNLTMHTHADCGPEVFFCTFEEFANNRVGEQFAEELSYKIIEKIEEYEAVRKTMTNLLEKMESLSFSSTRNVLTEKTNRNSSNKLIMGVFADEDECNYYYTQHSDLGELRPIMKPGTTRQTIRTTIRDDVNNRYVF
jgi:hypothetical protein